MQSKTNKRRKCAAVVVAAIKLSALKIWASEAGRHQDMAGQMLWLLFSKSNCKFYVTPTRQVDTQCWAASGHEDISVGWFMLSFALCCCRNVSGERNYFYSATENHGIYLAKKS